VFWPAYGVSLTARRKVRALKKKQIGLASLWRFWPLYDVFVSVVLLARTQDSIAIGSDAALARDKKPGISPGFSLLRSTFI